MDIQDYIQDEKNYPRVPSWWCTGTSVTLHPFPSSCYRIEATVRVESQYLVQSRTDSLLNLITSSSYSSSSYSPSFQLSLLALNEETAGGRRSGFDGTDEFALVSLLSVYKFYQLLVLFVGEISSPLA